MQADFIDLYNTLASYIPKLLNSDLLIAAIGAFAGAYGGQYIAERKRSKDVALAEIRAVNSAISSTFNIINTHLGLKKNHIQKIYDDYNTQRNQVVNALQNNLPGTSISVQFDLQILLPPLLPTDLLLKLLTEKITLDAASTNSCLTLLQTIRSLNDSLNSRNAAIIDFKSKNLVGSDAAKLYFGLPLANGSIDSTFEDCVSSIYGLLDDCIFFSESLIKKLVERGEILKSEYGDSSTSIAHPDFSKSREAGLFPDPENYKDWH